MAITATNRGATGTTRGHAGDMTVEEFRVWMRRFDANGDGRISRQELRRALRTIGCRFSGWRSGRWIGQADTDGDGLIDLDGEIENLIAYAHDTLGLNIVTY